MLSAELRSELQRNADAVDLKMVFLHAALTSVKSTKLCQPMPPSLAKDAATLAEKIRASEAVPKVHFLTGTQVPVRQETAQLLTWLSNASSSHARLAKVPLPEFLSSVNFPQNPSLGHLIPDYVFRVEYGTEHTVTTGTFSENAKRFGSFVGYHGSALGNWHSILHNGFSVDYCNDETVVFGNGLYFSTQPSVASNFTAPSSVWNNSSLGSSLSCLAVCEIVNHPSGIVRSSLDGDPSSSGLAAADRSLSGELPGDTVSATTSSSLPKSYVRVVTNGLVKVKYILVYKHANKRWMKMYFFIALYVLLLLVFGFVRSRNFKRILRSWGYRL